MFVESREIATCALGGGSDFITLMQLPQLPLTEMYGPYDPAFPAYDQELVMSTESGHVQLRYQLDPTTLYSEKTYAFRSGSTSKTSRELEMFKDFIVAQLRGRNVRHALEFGANDLSLARLMRRHAQTYSVCDPLLAEQDGQEIDGVQVIGKLVEDAISTGSLDSADLIIARHTLEHLPDPKQTLKALLDQSLPDCIFVFEVPSLEQIVEAQRFDAVFHQHLHYFDAGSARRLVWEVGGAYLGHQYNHRGSNGGSLMFAFTKGPLNSGPIVLDVAQKAKWVRDRVELFNRQMDISTQLIDQLPEAKLGFGAGHMLATLNYHLHGRVESLGCVLDDDPAKDGIEYANVKVSVRATAAFSPPAESSFVITSLENIRPIFGRLQSLEPRRIVVPLLA